MCVFAYVYVCTLYAFIFVSACVVGLYTCYACMCMYVYLYVFGCMYIMCMYVHMYVQCPYVHYIHMSMHLCRDVHVYNGCMYRFL